MAGSGRAPRDGTNAASRRARRSRGAAIIEAALVLPLLFLVLFGTIELGWLLKSYSSVAAVVNTGGRTASVAGNDADADRAILARMAGESGGLQGTEIDYVIIWRANAGGLADAPPAACIAIGEAGTSPNAAPRGISSTSSLTSPACNVYIQPQGVDGAFQLATVGSGSQPPEHFFGCTNPAQAGGPEIDCRWPAASRNTVISPRTLPAGCSRRSPDYVGVYVATRHDYLTGLIGSSLDLTDQSINLLEPSIYGCS